MAEMAAVAEMILTRLRRGGVCFVPAWLAYLAVLCSGLSRARGVFRFAKQHKRQLSYTHAGRLDIRDDASGYAVVTSATDLTRSDCSKAGRSVTLYSRYTVSICSCSML